MGAEVDLIQPVRGLREVGRLRAGRHGQVDAVPLFAGIPEEGCPQLIRAPGLKKREEVAAQVIGGRSLLGSQPR